jgi:hypothetical protein
VFLSPAERTGDVRRALSRLGEGKVVPATAVEEGLNVVSR